MPKLCESTDQVQGKAIVGYDTQKVHRRQFKHIQGLPVKGNEKQGSAKGIMNKIAMQDSEDLTVC